MWVSWGVGVSQRQQTARNGTRLTHILGAKAQAVAACVLRARRKLQQVAPILSRVLRLGMM